MIPDLLMAGLLLVFAGFFGVMGYKLNRYVVMYGALLFFLRSVFFALMAFGFLSDVTFRIAASRYLELLIYIWTAIVVLNGHINHLLTKVTEWTRLLKQSLDL